MSSIKKITLINPQDNKAITYDVSNFNGIKFYELTAIEQKFRNVRKEANILFMLAQSNPEVLKQQFETNPDIAQFKTVLDGIIKGDLTLDDVVTLFESNESEITKTNYQRRIEIVKTMIDQSKLTPEEVETLNSEEFWLFQDYDYIQETADFFRSKLRK